MATHLGTPSALDYCSNLLKTRSFRRAHKCASLSEARLLISVVIVEILMVVVIKRVGNVGYGDSLRYT